MNFGLKNIKVAYPGCKKVYDSFNDKQNEVLTFGLIGNSAINKSSNYCILALWAAKLLGLTFKFKLIAPKFDKDIFMKFLLTISGLRKITEILPKQDDMTNFYSCRICKLTGRDNVKYLLKPRQRVRRRNGNACKRRDCSAFPRIRRARPL